MIKVEKSVMSNIDKRLDITKILNPSNIEPKKESGERIFAEGLWYTVIDSHLGPVTGQLIDKDGGNYTIDQRPLGTGLHVHLNYHDLRFVIETEEIRD